MLRIMGGDLEVQTEETQIEYKLWFIANIPFRQTVIFSDPTNNASMQLLIN